MVLYMGDKQVNLRRRAAQSLSNLGRQRGVGVAKILTDKVATRVT